MKIVSGKYGCMDVFNRGDIIKRTKKIGDDDSYLLGIREGEYYIILGKLNYIQYYYPITDIPLQELTIDDIHNEEENKMYLYDSDILEGWNLNWVKIGYIKLS